MYKQIKKHKSTMRKSDHTRKFLVTLASGTTFEHCSDLYWKEDIIDEIEKAYFEDVELISLA